MKNREIRRQIDLHGNELKLKIDEIRGEMIDKTNIFEKSYLKEVSRKSEFIQLSQFKNLNEEKKDERKI